MSENEPPRATGRDFSLRSGERQFATALDEIRGDHVARYAFGLEHLPPGGFGLDVFCGNGYGSHMIASRGHHVLAMDASAGALTLARAHYETDRTYFVDRRWPFELPEQVFDFCFCLESIEHVVDGGAFLTALHTALKPGALLVLSTPNQDLMPFLPAHHKFHVRHYSQKDTFNLFRQRRMEIIAWGGQTVYDIHPDGTHVLSHPDAPVTPEVAGQFLIAVGRKEDPRRAQAPS